MVSFDLLNEQLVKPLKISIFHSGFNIVNILILIWFIKSFVKFSEWLIPIRAKEDQDHKLTYHNSLIVSISEISISHVTKELDEMAKQTTLMFAMIPRLLLEKDVESYEIMYHDLKRREEKTDKLEAEIMNF